MSNGSPPSAAARPVRTYLSIHSFPPDIPADELYKIGHRYLRMFFARNDSKGARLPVCHTDDGIPVEFSLSNSYHFLSRDVPQNMLMRVQRLHWIVPIVRKEVQGKICIGEVTEKGIKKRIYYQPQLKYAIILNYKNPHTLELNTAYRVTELYMRLKLQQLCRQKKPAELSARRARL